MTVILKGPSRLSRNVDDNGVKTYRASYRLRATAPPSVDGEDAVAAALGIDVGDLRPDGSGAVCTSIECRCEDRKGIGKTPLWNWVADVEWSTTKPGDKQDPKQKDPNPLQRPVKISMDVVLAEEPTWKDLDGNPVQNSAEDPVPRPKKRGRMIFRYEKNVPSFNWHHLREAPNGFLLSRNQNAFNPQGPYAALFGANGIAAGKGQIVKLSADTAFENDLHYVVVKMEVATDEDDFKDIFIDQGFFYLGTNQEGFLVSKWILVNGQRAQTPQLLNGFGEVGDVPVNLEFQYYPLMDWTPLGIPGEASP